MSLIYDDIKSGKSVDLMLFGEIVSELRRKGCQHIILGCTELPILADTLSYPGPYIDPTAELAKAAIRFCGYQLNT